MQRRYPSHALEAPCLPGRGVALVSRPPRSGRTTFAKRPLAERGAGQYGPWDEPMFGRAWTRDRRGRARANAEQEPLLALDELPHDGCALRWVA